MSTEDPRKAYWNNHYMEYWRARVKEAGTGNSGVIRGDTRTEGDHVYQQVFDAIPFRPGKLLDVGCAWGRMFPLYLEHNVEVSGIDISLAMISSAHEKWDEHASIATLAESSAERMPFADATFDNLVCIATFDATFQHLAMQEFLRVTRPGAQIYLTGKNSFYHTDDEAALAAEAGARRKGHPNYFTRTLELISIMEHQGHRMIEAYYFSKRGDFAKLDYSSTAPERFYEYFLIFQRGLEYVALPNFSDEFSVTFREMTGTDADT